MVMRFLHDPNPQGQFFGDMRVFKGGGGSAPAAPDPAQTAAAQSKYGKETALWNSALNNVQQFTPYGSLTYTLGSATPSGGSSQTTTQPASATASGLYTDASGNIKTVDYLQGLADKGGSWSKTGDNYIYQPSGRAAMNPKNTRQEWKPYNSVDGAGVSGSKYAGYSAGELPQWTSRVELSPEMQAIFDSQMRQQEKLGGLAENALGQVESAYNTPYSYDTLNPLYGQDDLNAARLRTEDALYSRLNPQFDRDEEALRTRLINQGISQGSEAYNREMERFNQAKNDARMQAILAGGTEADRLFSQSLASRQQGISELDKLRAQPLNEYLAMSGQQQLQNPQFQQYSYQGAATPDYQGLVNQNYQNQMAQYNAKQASSNNLTSSLFGLGGQLAGSYLGSAAGSAWLAGLSDRRAKENIKHIGERDGFSIYDFNYKGDKTRYRGVMAQDVQEIMPEAVKDIGGLLHVNYDMIGFPMEVVSA